METVLTIIAIAVALIIWIVEKEHDVIVNFYAFSITILKQLESILSPFGASTSLTFAKIRAESFEKEEMRDGVKS